MLSRFFVFSPVFTRIALIRGNILISQIRYRINLSDKFVYLWTYLLLLIVRLDHQILFQRSAINLFQYRS